MDNDAGGAAAFIVQLIPLLVVSVILLIPFLRILRRIGRSRWWALVLFVPPFGFLVLPWLIAFMRWNRDTDATIDVFR